MANETSDHASRKFTTAETPGSSVDDERRGSKSSQTVNFEDIWSSISHGLDRIMSDPKSLDQRSYVALYELIYNYCMLPNPALKWAWESPRELYVRLDEYLRRHVQNERATIQALTGDDAVLLLSYVDRWNRYSEAAEFNSRLFTFLHRHWISRELDEGHKVLEITPLHLQRWKEAMFEKMPDNEIVSALLRMAEKSRDSRGSHSRDAVKSTLASLRSLNVELDEATQLMLVDFAT